MSMSSEEFKEFLAKASASTQARNAHLLARPGPRPSAPYVPPPLPDVPDNSELIRKAIALGIQPSTDEAKLNKLEKSYLQWLRTLADYWIGIQCITLKLGHDCRYTADFAAVDKQGLRLIDVKGPHVWEDSLIKLRVAPRLYPFIRFVIATQEENTWRHREIKP